MKPRHADTTPESYVLPFTHTLRPKAADPSPSATPTLSEDTLRLEEYALYDAILQDMVAGSQLQCIVLKDHTTMGSMSEADEKSMDYLRSNLEGVPENLLEDFFSRNRKSVGLSPSFTVDIPVLLLSEDEISVFFSEDGGGWDGFYETNKGAQGIMEFSRAGFNAGMDRALVYTGNQAHYLAGAGHLLVMEKRDGVWTTIQSLMVWIS
jgi:hypothetical protein